MHTHTDTHTTLQRITNVTHCNVLTARQQLGSTSPQRSDSVTTAHKLTEGEAEGTDDHAVMSV